MFHKSVAIVALVLLLASTALAQQWNLDEANIALRLSWASYCPPQEVTSWSCYWCRYTGTPLLNIVGTTIDGGSSTMGYVGYTGDTVYAVFRGTTNLKNVLVDLTIKKDEVWSDQPDAKVHKGFGKSWKSLSSGILSAIDTARSRCSSCNRVFFAGHSLGGAIATIAAVDYARRKPSGMSVQSLTLGSPRVGNEDFAEYAARMVPNSIRWTNSNDPVPHLPLSVMGFDHRPREVWQRSSTYQLCSQTNGEDSNCANSVSGFSINSLEKHSEYGGIDLHDGTCETFSGSRRNSLSQQDIQALIDTANLDLTSN